MFAIMHISAGQWARWALPVWVLCLSGCSIVLTEQPVGEPVPAETARSLSGVWLTPDGDPMFVHHTEGNQLRVAEVQRKRNGFSLNELNVSVTTLGDAMFVNLGEKPSDSESSDKDRGDNDRPSDEGREGQSAADQPPDYTFLRIVQPQDDTVILYGPEVKPFAQAVKQGDISGTVTKNGSSTTVRLTGPTSELQRVLSDEHFGEYFNIDNPLTLRRIKRNEDKQQED